MVLALGQGGLVVEHAAVVGRQGASLAAGSVLLLLRLFPLLALLVCGEKSRDE